MKHDITLSEDGRWYICLKCGLKINRSDQRAMERFKTKQPVCREKVAELDSGDSSNNIAVSSVVKSAQPEPVDS